MITFALAILEAAAAANQQGLAVAAIKEHPADLGRTSTGRPASIWQLPRMRALIQSGFITFAFHQCFFDAELAKPTRFMTNVAGLQEHWTAGWPILSADGRYLGPLPLACGHHHPRTADGSAEGKAILARSAAFTGKMNEWIAKHVVKYLTLPSPPLAGVGSVEGREQRARQRAGGLR